MDKKDSDFWEDADFIFQFLLILYILFIGMIGPLNMKIGLLGTLPVVTIMLWFGIIRPEILKWKYSNKNQQCPVCTKEMRFFYYKTPGAFLGPITSVEFICSGHGHAEITEIKF